MVLIGEESHQKKIQNYRPINKNLPAVFSFRGNIAGGIPKNRFRASIKSIFENHVFRAVWSPFYPLKRPKNENSWQTFVYGSIILKKKKIGGSPHLYAPLVKSNKQN